MEKIFEFNFRLGEGEPNPLEFTFEGKSYVFYDGTTISLPYEEGLKVFEHLNSLKYPYYGYVRDEKTGQLVSKSLGYKHRFFCIPLSLNRNSESQEESDRVGSASGGKEEPSEIFRKPVGRPPKESRI